MSNKYISIGGFLFRYIANNPWSCDKSTLVVMQTELAELVDSNKNLEDFDGGKVQCFDPPSMKGRRPLHLINGKFPFLFFSAF